MSRFLTVVLTLALLWMQYRLWWGTGSSYDNTRLAEQIALQQKKLDAVAQRNRVLRNDIDNLKKGNEALEELAREQLGLIKPKEHFFRVIRTSRK